MSKGRANAVLILVAMIWGSSFVAQKIGGGSMDTLGFVACRFFLGGLTVLPLCWRDLARLAALPRADRLGLLATGTALFLGSVLQQYGVDTTSVTNAGFLTGLYVLLVPLLGWLVLGLRPPPVIWLSATACLLGSWLLSGGGGLSFAAGDLWVMASALFWACHVLLVGHMARRTGLPVLVACLQFMICAAWAGGGELLLAAHPFTGLTAGWPAVAYLGFFSVGVAFTLQSLAQRHAAPSHAAIILAGEGVFSAIGGALVLGEAPGWLQMAGGGAILAGMLLIQLAPGEASGEPRAAE